MQLLEGDHLATGEELPINILQFKTRCTLRMLILGQHLVENEVIPQLKLLRTS